MAWLESHDTLANHPKTLKLARLLGISRVTACGHLHFLWWWAMDYAQDGDLSRFDALDVAIACDWDGDPGELVDSLKAAGFVDQDGKIHDWQEYAGRLIERRRADAERKRIARSGDVQRTSAGHPEDGVRNPTVPNLTVPNGPPLVPPAGGKAKRATVMLETWEPDDGLRVWASEQGFTWAWVERETAKFRNHFLASGKPMKDWGAAWRNWMLRSREYAVPARASPSNGKRATVEDFLDIARGGLVSDGQRGGQGAERAAGAVSEREALGSGRAPPHPGLDDEPA